MTYDYENVRQFWERRFAQNLSMNVDERELEMRRMADAVDAISRGGLLKVHSQSVASRPFIVAEMDDLREELMALQRQLYGVERVCQEEKCFMEDVQRQNLACYNMAYQANWVLHREQVASNRQKKLLQLTAYYLPMDLQRQVKNLTGDNMIQKAQRSPNSHRKDEIMPLEFRRSNNDIDRLVGCQHDRPDCCALVAWTDYRDYWPVYCRQMPLCHQESLSSPDDNSDGEWDYKRCQFSLPVDIQHPRMGGK